jgi:DNA-binding CsgD family transcriptional regulator
MSRPNFYPELRGRGAERQILDQLLRGARAGRSQVLVLHGEAGIGKTALLGYLLSQASGCRVASSAGVESEMELPYASLQQLCSPFLGFLDRLPGPQRDALETAFGLRAGAVPDRFLVGLAVLGLLAEVATEEPLLCVIDDAQWLDRASTQTLTFVARRLVAEPIGVVFALREFGSQQDLSSLAQLAVKGLAEADAHALLDALVPGVIEPEVRNRVVAEAHGNPLALLELPHWVTANEMVFGVDAGSTTLANRIEQGFLRRLQPLPIATQCLLLLSAAEPSGNVVLLWRAASRLGIEPGAEREAVAAGLVERGRQMRFQHPLVRSAVYRAAADHERRRVHLALAEATDAHSDPDRRAWHYAQAAAGPDDAVADALEASAERARTRGGVAAVAAFLEQAAHLTTGSALRARRALAAAQAHHEGGLYAAALALLAQAGDGPLTVLEHARTDLLRAQITFASTFGADAPPMLLKAAVQLQPLDLQLARETYLEAMVAARFAAAGDGAGIVEVARAVTAAPAAPGEPSAADLLVDGLAVRFLEGYPAGIAPIRRALAAFASPDLPPPEGLRWLWHASMTALELWDDRAWLTLADRHLRLVRDQGAILNDEAQRVTELLGGQLGPYASLNFAATQGSEGAARDLMTSAMREVENHGQGMGSVIVGYAGALLFNGLGRYAEALSAAERAVTLSEDLGGNQWALAELVEAAHHSHQSERGADALRRLSRTTDAAGTDWGLGLQASLTALTSEGDTADRLHREAIARLGRTRIRLALARAHLLYGEWLRRENRRLDAREHLRSAYKMLSAMGVEGFAERARRELVATGEATRRAPASAQEKLTAQEEQIARLVSNGRTNPEIGAELFISARTVEWHLRKIFTKLDITSRKQLRNGWPSGAASVSA